MSKIICEVCASGGHEIKILLHSIRLKLETLTSQYVPDYHQDTEVPLKLPDSFARLLTVVIGDSSTNTPLFLLCPHQKFSRYLRRKLKCDNKMFNHLCHQLVNKMAKRNYQLEVLNLQLKNISETCLKLSKDQKAQLMVIAKKQRNLEEAKQKEQNFERNFKINHQKEWKESIFIQKKHNIATYSSFGQNFGLQSAYMPFYYPSIFPYNFPQYLPHQSSQSQSQQKPN